MRKVTALLVPMLSAAVLLAACGSSSSTSSSSTSGSSQPAASQPSGGAAAVVKTASNSALRATVLVDSQGLTLYHLSGEQNGKWICTSAGCLQAWHPLTVKTGAAPSGSVGSLGTIKRPDGTVQVTYKGMPLYTFAQDQKSGDAKGQGIKDVGIWTAVATTAVASSTPATSTPAAPSSSGGGGYAY